MHISSRLLHITLESYGFAEDKRYNAPYLNCESLEAQLLYLRGLFDGDGSLYYEYVSGRFEGINFQITTGSEEVQKGLYNFLTSLGIGAYKDKAVSAAGNTYYHVGIRNKKGIVKLFPLLYKDSKSICLYRKYKNYLKLLELIEMNNRVDDIVEPPMKIGE
jgi:intein/homing endonuclease